MKKLLFLTARNIILLLLAAMIIAVTNYEAFFIMVGLGVSIPIVEITFHAIAKTRIRSKILHNLGVVVFIISAGLFLTNAMFYRLGYVTITNLNQLDSIDYYQPSYAVPKVHIKFDAPYTISEPVKVASDYDYNLGGRFFTFVCHFIDSSSNKLSPFFYHQMLRFENRYEYEEDKRYQTIMENPKYYDLDEQWFAPINYWDMEMLEGYSSYTQIHHDPNYDYIFDPTDITYTNTFTALDYHPPSRSNFHFMIFVGGLILFNIISYWTVTWR